MNLCVQLCLKLMVSNVGPSHFLFNSVFRGGLLSSLFMWACCSRVLKPYRHHHTPPLPLLCPTTPSPLLDYPHSPFPMSALRAIIIMPCINNASQYINNTVAWREELGEWGLVMVLEGGGVLTASSWFGVS